MRCYMHIACTEAFHRINNEDVNSSVIRTSFGPGLFKQHLRNWHRSIRADRGDVDYVVIAQSV